jgi:hypothetical protein
MPRETRRASPGMTGSSRDTFVTHDLDRSPELTRDGESRSACSATISDLRSWLAPGVHQSMLYYDI